MTQAAPSAEASAPRLPSNTLATSLGSAELAGVGRSAMCLGSCGVLHLAQADNPVALDTLLEEWGGFDAAASPSPGDKIASSKVAREYRKRRDLALVPHVGFLHFHTTQGSGLKLVHAAASDPAGQMLYIWPTDYIPRVSAGINAYRQAARLSLALSAGLVPSTLEDLEDLARKLVIG